MVRLEKISGKNVWDALRLSVKEDQRDFVASNDISIIEAYTTITANGNYNLWRLMIDQKYQHRGYGKKAIELALEFVRTFPCGKAEYCWLSYEPENVVAKELYTSFGFEETGEKDGEELIAVLKL